MRDSVGLVFGFCLLKKIRNNLQIIPVMLEETKITRKMKNEMYFEANKNMSWARLTDRKMTASSRLS